MKKIILAATASYIMMGCSGPKLPSQVAPEALLYQQRCSACHEPVPAEMYQVFQWERLLTLLERNLEPYHQQEEPLISSDDKVQLLDYLKKYAKADEDVTVESMQEQLRALGDSN